MCKQPWRMQSYVVPPLLLQSMTIEVFSQTFLRVDSIYGMISDSWIEKHLQSRLRSNVTETKWHEFVLRMVECRFDGSQELKNVIYSLATLSILPMTNRLPYVRALARELECYQMAPGHRGAGRYNYSSDDLRSNDGNAPGGPES